MFAAISALYVNPTYSSTSRTWLNEVTVPHPDAFGFGGDFSIFLGMGVAALVYLVLAVRQGAQGGRRPGGAARGRRGC